MKLFDKIKAFVLGNPTSVNQKYAQGLEKSKTGFKARLNALFARYRKIDETFFEELESFLIESDMGGKLAYDLIETMKAQTRLQKLVDPRAIIELLVENLYHVYSEDLDSVPKALHQRPHVILVVGVNGVGKTTSIAKLAAAYQKQGLAPLLVAGDTFRAGAVEQLQIWADRLHVPLIKGQENSDPASVIFDGISQGMALQSDIIICDTAGRLHTKKHLMEELSKIQRVMEKKLGRGPDEVLLVVDATTGQNGIYQAKAFVEATNVSAIILTKVDGTSKGGIIFAIKDQLQLSVKYIGLGEKLDDLQEFDINNYLHGLFAELLE